MSKKAKTLDINDFVGKNDPREWLCAPFPINGKLAATDGKTAFLSNIEASGSAPETEHIGRVERFFQLAAESNFFPMPKLKFPEEPACEECEGTGKSSSKTCPECDGFGEATAETDYNSYEVECRSCHGGGQIKDANPDKTCSACSGKARLWTENDRMQIEGVPFDVNPRLILRIAKVPGMHVAVIEGNEISRSIAFKCADGIGIIMGMRDKS